MAALTLAPVDALSSQWHPDPGGLAQVTALLSASTGGPPTTPTATSTPSSHQGLYQQLQDLANNPQFNNYLAYILLRGSDDKSGDDNGNVKDKGIGSVAGTVEEAKLLVIRQAAGLLLKNNLKSIWELMSEEAKGFVVAAVVGAVSDPRAEIRGVAASCIGVVIQLGRKDVVRFVVESLSRAVSGEWGGEYAVRGALLTFGRVAEDKPEALEPWLAPVLERVLMIVKGTESGLRYLALDIVNRYLLVLPKVFVEKLDAFLRIVFSAASDPSPKVRAKVCAATVLLLGAYPYALEKHMDELLPFMLTSSTDGSDLVKREAIEFWPVYCVMPGAKERVRPVLAKILTILTEGIIFSEEEQITMDTETTLDESEAPEREQDVHPRQFLASAMTQSARLKRVASTDGMDTEDDEDEDELYDTADIQNSVRSTSARALEKLASVFGVEMLKILLPMLQEKLESPQWAVRESGVLILGALSLDCYPGMVPHLPTLIPFLVSNLSDPHPCVRCISCWTLGRYAKFTVTEPDLLASVYDRTLQCALDKSKKVQKAAMTSICDILESGATPMLNSVLAPTLGMIKVAFNRYRQTRTFSVLCDLVATLASNVREELAKPEYTAALLSVLIETWKRLPPRHLSIATLLTCMAEVARCLGSACHEYTHTMYVGALKLVSTSYNEDEGESSQASKSLDEKQELIASALDLICAIFETHSPGSYDFAEKELFEYVYRAIQDPRNDVRFPACGVIGEMARLRLSFLRAAIRDYTIKLQACLNPEYPRIANNAAWALGQLVMYSGYRGGDALQDFKDAFSGRGIDFLVRSVLRGKNSTSLVQNCAICLGRLAWVVPSSLEDKFASLADRWMFVLRHLKDDEEKEHSYNGLCRMAQHSPQVIVDNFAAFCDTVCSWWNMKRELESDFRDIFVELCAALGENWTALKKDLPEVLQMCLQKKFDL